METLEKETVTKADIVDQVYEKIGFTRKEAEEAVDIIFDQIKAVEDDYYYDLVTIW